MTNINLRKVFNNNYICRISLIISILAPLFSILVVLSVLGIIPKFPLTQNMTMSTSIVVLVVSIVVICIGVLIIKNTISKLKIIFDKGSLSSALVTKLSSSKHSISISYEFSIDGKKITDSHTLSKKLGYKKHYTVGQEIEIYVLDYNDNISSAPNIYI